MVKTRYVPDVGHIIKIDLDPSKGHEQAGRRPALVLSPYSYNKRTDLAVVVPITSHKKGYPFEVELPAKLKITGVVLSDHLKNLDWSVRNATYEAEAPAEVLRAVRERVRRLLGILDEDEVT